MVHPQKRIDVKQVMEVVTTRVVELKHDLVKWNPPNPDVQTQPERSFPWEYVNLDDILVDLKLPPETLEIPVPKSFVEDHAEELLRRERVRPCAMSCVCLSLVMSEVVVVPTAT